MSRALELSAELLIHHQDNFHEVCEAASVELMGLHRELEAEKVARIASQTALEALRQERVEATQEHLRVADWLEERDATYSAALIRRYYAITQKQLDGTVRYITEPGIRGPNDVAPLRGTSQREGT